MTLIVGLFAIVFLLAGYYVMGKIDNFIGNKVVLSNSKTSDEMLDKKETKQEVILIYGENELTSLIKSYCDSQEYIYESITEINHISTKYKYCCLLALSYNDADNLMVSSIGLKIYSISKIITLCNNRDHLKIYNDFNFDNVLIHDHVNKLFNIVKELVENAVENKNQI